MLIAVTAPTALAQDDHKEAVAVPAKLVESTPDLAPAVPLHGMPKLAGRYFVDFRARTAASW